jgi:hypothetical protein
MVNPKAFLRIRATRGRKAGDLWTCVAPELPALRWRVTSSNEAAR